MDNLFPEDIMFKRISGEEIDFGYITQKKRRSLVEQCVKFGILEYQTITGPKFKCPVYKVKYPFTFKEMRSPGVVRLRWFGGEEIVQTNDGRLYL